MPPKGVFTEKVKRVNTHPGGFYWGLWVKYDGNGYHNFTFETEANSARASLVAAVNEWHREGRS